MNENPYSAPQTSPLPPPKQVATSTARTWSICGMLLLASAINYMDRQTLANASVRITEEFGLSEEQYGNLETGFGWAFAVGSLFFGFLADKVSLRWLYAAVLLLWSAMGFASGFADNYEQLLGCRTLLGFFEAGHWPCGIKTVRALLDARGRAMGNSVLQSGTSIGAIVTPLIMLWLLTDEVGSWRFPFQAVGAVGAVWVLGWLAIAPADNTAADQARDHDVRDWWRIFLDRRLFIVLAVISLINTTFQMLRAWLPKFLQQGHGYGETESLYFNSFWFATTDIGCIGAGALALWLSRRKQGVVRARLVTFFLCAMMSSVTLSLPWLASQSWLQLAVLLIAGAGALGVFPIYHAFTQDISHEHQGKVTGIAGVAGWALAPAHKWFGRYIDSYGSYDLGFALVGALPIVAFLILVLFWPRMNSSNT